MAEQKKSDFVVSDRRKFTIEGDLKPEAREHSNNGALPDATKPPQAAAVSAEASSDTEQQPPAPSAAEQRQQADAYRSHTADIDAHIQKELDQRSPGRKASDFEMTFDKFIASLYMTALMQLGLVHEQGMSARPDIMAARQTIDTISILADKTKGNLTAAEDTLMQNVLYELRMAYIEVTNALTSMPQGPVDPNAGLK
jgi:hypothetical protein